MPITIKVPEWSPFLTNAYSIPAQSLPKRGPTLCSGSLAPPQDSVLKSHLQILQENIISCIRKVDTIGPIRISSGWYEHRVWDNPTLQSIMG